MFKSNTVMVFFGKCMFLSIRNVKFIIKMRLLFTMSVAAVCVLYLNKLTWFFLASYPRILTGQSTCSKYAIKLAVVILNTSTGE